MRCNFFSPAGTVTLQTFQYVTLIPLYVSKVYESWGEHLAFFNVTQVEQLSHAHREHAIKKKTHTEL